MAKKKKDSDKSSAEDDGGKKGKEKEAEVGDPNAPGLPGYIAIGLLASLVVGWGALRDAFLGYGPLDDAMARFVVGLLACVAGASLIGRMLDGAPPVTPGEPDDSSDSGDGGDASLEAGSADAVAAALESEAADLAPEAGIDEQIDGRSTGDRADSTS